MSCPTREYLPMASLQRYTDRRVFITGGGSGIGQATVLRILDEGGRVVAADISEAGLKDTTSAAFAHPYMAAYAASKAGVQAMTHALALEFVKEGIRFNAVQPGSISSGMTDGTGESKQSIGPGLPADADFSLFTKVTPMLPLEGGGMFAKPDAVASVVATLCSTHANFVTGTEGRIDGGTHM